MNDCITTTKQSTTKPCAYFLGYTVGPHPIGYIIQTTTTVVKYFISDVLPWPQRWFIPREQHVTWLCFYQTRSAWSMDQGSNKNNSPINNFTHTVTKFCVTWEGQALPHDTKFRNCRGEIVDSRAFYSWSLIHGSSWSGLIKAEPDRHILSASIWERSHWPLKWFNLIHCDRLSILTIWVEICVDDVYFEFQCNCRMSLNWTFHFHVYMNNLNLLNKGCFDQRKEPFYC